MARSARLALPRSFPLAIPAVPRALLLTCLSSRTDDLAQISLLADEYVASDVSPSELQAVDSVMVDKASWAEKALIDKRGTRSVSRAFVEQGTWYQPSRGNHVGGQVH